MVRIERNEATARRERVSSMPVMTYAGTSERRLAFLKYAFPNFQVEASPGGPEEQIGDVMRIAKNKIAFAVANDPDTRQSLRSPSNILIACDILTNPLVRYATDNSSRTVHRGKPYGKEDVRSTFKRISRAGQYMEGNPYYRIDSGTAILRGSEGKPAQTKTITHVELDKGKMYHFSTPKGFEDYLTAFGEIYNSEEYLSIKAKNEKRKKLELTDVAGGLSLVTLLKTGAVLEIDGVARGSTALFDEAFFKAARNALFNVLVGFSPQLLKAVRPDIDKAIEEWPWINQMTHLALSTSQAA